VDGGREGRLGDLHSVLESLQLEAQRRAMMKGRERETLVRAGGEEDVYRRSAR